MPWTIVRHWAELALLLAVLNLFEHCHSLEDAFEVVRRMDDISRLGVATASAIATSGLGAMLKALVHAARLPTLGRWVISLARTKW